jgi:hypothetical protein
MPILRVPSIVEPFQAYSILIINYMCLPLSITLTELLGIFFNEHVWGF